MASKSKEKIMSKGTKTVVAKPVAKKAAAKTVEKKAPAKAAKPAAEKKVAAKTAPKAEEKKVAKVAAPKAAPAKKPAAPKVAAKPAAEKKPAAKKAAAPKAAKKIAVVLTTPTAYELASKVTVAGSFNEWNQATAIVCKKDKKTGLWSAKLSLVAGTYQYKFICDDQYWDEGDNKVVEVK